MTNYYYIAADIELKREQYNEHVFSLEQCPENIKGFDVPIQFEIYNGLDRKRELQSLLQFIYQQADGHKRCTFQIANLINSNRVPYMITEKKHVLLHKIKSEQELLLKEGQLLTIEKVQVVY